MTRRYSSCSYCGGAVEERHIRVEVWFGESLVIFEDVPAGVCGQCGEEYIAADIQDKMFALSKTRPSKKLVVPVYTFGDPKAVEKAETKRRKHVEPFDDIDGRDIRLPTDDELASLLGDGFEEVDED
ncbi:MAG: type II toxin-antitoxin system MqsA family antitoxin [Bacteroidota bacterium]|nr:type II toxin-antitoxin system MqsA family antitoxin [Bacteroidota bacterium]